MAGLFISDWQNVAAVVRPECGVFVLLYSRGPMSLSPQPHGRRIHHVRPCERNEPQNAANWNHRA